MTIIEWALVVFFVCGLLSFIAIPAWSIWDDYRHHGPFKKPPLDSHYENHSEP